ncbi:STAS domain-containing protein [Jeotgalibacillus aurantiacus]|uniref:STAS domain-containing protein n=1 Tax=Jeotgalibacillus aurantiacus TaxID=2763266 RepID=UPI001D09E20D|nr:STAS domain-containing protein [Jeotgalibacillus aurantiacus]
MITLDTMPLPAFKMSQDLTILEASEDARQLFGHAPSFLDWVDVESREKAQKFMSTQYDEKVELNLVTTEGIISSYILHIKWDGQEGTVLMQQQDQMMLKLMHSVNEHRRRLEESDMELILKKNELEKSLIRIQELSTAVIHLTPNVVLIPIFGDLNIELILSNKDRILKQLYDEQIDELIIDLQAVGKITDDGVEEFSLLLKNCSLLGATCSITGIRPEHVPQLHQKEIAGKVMFINSLKDTLTRIVS